MHWTNTKSQALLEALKEGFPDSSRNTLRSWISEERILVGKKVISDARYVVQPGQTISLGRRKRFMDEGIEILYEDDHIVVVCKPSSVLSVATNFDLSKNVHAFLKKRFHNRTVYPVHRLDKDVSGVMVFAYHKKAQEILKHQFAEHSIFRQYIAVVEGNLQPLQGTWQSYLQEDERYYVRSVQDPSQGELATTHYKVIKQGKFTSTLLVSLETGKKNQIRVHCKESGHPILGDTKYGSSTRQAGRIALHAYKLGINHPILENPMMFTKEAPQEFAKYLP